MKIFIVVFLISLLAFPVQSAIQATNDRLDRGHTHLMCDTETDTGICERSSEDIYAIVDSYDSITFFFYETGSGSTCDVYATGESHGTIASGTDLSAAPFSAANKINSVALSSTQDKITFSGVDFKYVWVSCTISGTNATVEMIGSVGMSRQRR